MPSTPPRPLDKAGMVYSVWAELLAGQARVAGPKPGLEQGLAPAAEGSFTLQAAGSGAGQVGQLLVQAQMLVRGGHTEMAIEALDQALAWIERTGVRVMEAEVWRMRGELLLAERTLTPPTQDGRGPSPEERGEAGEAEACFRRALEVAREQQARWLELRAAASLARLWHSLRSQGRRDEARELLAGIYGWFREGFDTVDLVEAKGLLEELE